MGDDLERRGLAYGGNPDALATRGEGALDVLDTASVPSWDAGNVALGSTDATSHAHAVEAPQVDLSRLRIDGMRVSVTGVHGGISVDVEMRCARLQNPRDSQQVVSRFVLEAGRYRRSEVNAFIRDAVAAMLVHEVDETLWIDGQRLVDPHPGGNADLPVRPPRPIDHRYQFEVMHPPGFTPTDPPKPR